MLWKHDSFIRYGKLNWRPVIVSEGLLSGTARRAGNRCGIGNMGKVCQKNVWMEENRMTRPCTQYVCNKYELKNMSGGWLEWWIDDGESGKMLTISNFTVLLRIKWGIIFDCYIAFCYSLCCSFPSMSEKNKTIMSSNHYLCKAKDIFCSASFIFCFILMRGFKTPWKVPTLKAAFCFAHLT